MSPDSALVPQCTILQNGLLVTFTEADAIDAIPAPKRVDVLVVNERIAEIAAPGTLSLKDGESIVVDCSTMWIAPGFVDTHRHLWMSICRGQEDWTLPEYLAKQVFTLQPAVTPEDVFIGQLAGCLQALHAGVTSVVDHMHASYTSAHIHSAVDATAITGLRGMVCPSRHSAPTSFVPLEFKNEAASAEEQLTTLSSLVKSLKEEHKGPLPRTVTLGLSYDSFGHDKEADAHVLRTARELGLSPITAHYVGGPQAQIHTHLARRWADAGLLGPDVLFSHANGLAHVGADEREWSLLKESGASIGSTPEDELGMGHGDPVAYEAIKHGVQVGLGIDCTSIVSAEMFPAMHFALQWARGQVHHANAHPAAGTPKTVKHNALSSASVFRMATLGGAHAAKRGAETGSIEPGKFADIVLYDADSIALGGASDPFKGIALHATAEDVSWVFVGGRIVKKEGKLVDVEVRGEKWGWKNVVKELRERSDALHKRVEHIDQEERYNTMLKMFHVPVVE